MILLDTSVLVRYLRRPSPATRTIFASVDCGVCGVTRAELLHGARSAEDAAALVAALDAFRQVPIFESTWNQLGKNLAALRSKGLPVPFPDALIATVAIEHEAELWADDAHYRAIQTVLTELRLFDGPS